MSGEILNILSNDVSHELLHEIDITLRSAENNNTPNRRNISTPNDHAAMPAVIATSSRNGVLGVRDNLAAPPPQPNFEPAIGSQHLDCLLGGCPNPDSIKSSNSSSSNSSCAGDDGDIYDVLDDDPIDEVEPELLIDDRGADEMVVQAGEAAGQLGQVDDHERALVEFADRFNTILSTERFCPDNFNTFEIILNEFIIFCQNHVKLPPIDKKKKKLSYRPVSVDDARELQKQYKRNRRQTIRTIRGEGGEYCEIDPDAVAGHFCLPRSEAPDDSSFLNTDTTNIP